MVYARGTCLLPGDRASPLEFGLKLRVGLVGACVCGSMGDGWDGQAYGLFFLSSLLSDSGAVP